MFFSDRGHTRDHDYYVYNPTTKQCAIVLPMVWGLDALRKCPFYGACISSNRLSAIQTYLYFENYLRMFECVWDVE